VKEAGCVVTGSVELQVPVCAGKKILLPRVPSNGAWSHGATSGVGSGVLCSKLFFPFFPWLLAFLFVDLLLVGLLLAGYGTPWVPQIFLFQVVSSCCTIRMSTICHLASPLVMYPYQTKIGNSNSYMHKHCLKQLIFVKLISPRNNTKVEIMNLTLLQ
jgi:hypothetical protein